MHNETDFQGSQQNMRTRFESVETSLLLTEGPQQISLVSCPFLNDAEKTKATHGTSKVWESFNYNIFQHSRENKRREKESAEWNSTSVNIALEALFSILLKLKTYLLEHLLQMKCVINKAKLIFFTFQK